MLFLNYCHLMNSSNEKSVWASCMSKDQTADSIIEDSTMRNARRGGSRIPPRPKDIRIQKDKNLEGFNPTSDPTDQVRNGNGKTLITDTVDFLQGGPPAGCFAGVGFEIKSVQKKRYLKICYFFLKVINGFHIYLYQAANFLFFYPDKASNTAYFKLFWFLNF